MISIAEGHPVRVAEKLKIRVHALANKTPTLAPNDLPDLTDQEKQVAKRIAELWAQGEGDAQAHVEWAVLGGERIFRVQVKRADGMTEMVSHE